MSSTFSLSPMSQWRWNEGIRGDIEEGEDELPDELYWQQYDIFVEESHVGRAFARYANAQNVPDASNESVTVSAQFKMAGANLPGDHGRHRLQPGAVHKRIICYTEVVYHGPRRDTALDPPWEIPIPILICYVRRPQEFEFEEETPEDVIQWIRVHSVKRAFLVNVYPDAKLIPMVTILGRPGSRGDGYLELDTRMIFIMPYQEGEVAERTTSDPTKAKPSFTSLPYARMYRLKNYTELLKITRILAHSIMHGKRAAIPSPTSLGMEELPTVDATVW